MTVQKPCASSDATTAEDSSGFNERVAACWDGYSNVYDAQLREFEATLEAKREQLDADAAVRDG